VGEKLFNNFEKYINSEDEREVHGLLSSSSSSSIDFVFTEKGPHTA
jgi:hypothetical protein